MAWRHLLSMLFLLVDAFLGVLNYFQLLPRLLGWMGSWAVENFPIWYVKAHYFGVELAKLAWQGLNQAAEFVGMQPGPGAFAVIFFGCLALHDYLIGYAVGMLLDSPLVQRLERNTEETKQEEEEHRDLRIAARVLDRVEQAEKQRLKDKVDRLKREANEKKAGKAGEAEPAT